MTQLIGNQEAMEVDGGEEAKQMELPILVGSDRGREMETSNGGRIEGVKKKLKESATEIPDSDAVSPPSTIECEETGVGDRSMEIRAPTEILGGEEKEVGDDVVTNGPGTLEIDGRNGEPKDMLMFDQGSEETVMTMTITTEAAVPTEPAVSEAQNFTLTESGLAALRKDGEMDGAFASPTNEPPPLRSPSPDIQDNLPKPYNISTAHARIMENPASTLVDESSNKEDVLFAEDAQNPTSADLGKDAGSKEGDLEEKSTPPLEGTVGIETPAIDDGDIMIMEDDLPTEKISFLQRALQADEALSAQEASTTEDAQLTGENPPAEKALPTEIPPSDDEGEAMDEDTDPLKNIFEFHTTQGSSAEDPDTFFMNVQPGTQREDTISTLSSTAEAEAPVDPEPDSVPIDVDLADAPSLNTNAPGKISFVLEDPLMSTFEPSSIAMDLDSGSASPAKERDPELSETHAASLGTQDLGTTRVSSAPIEEAPKPEIGSAQTVIEYPEIPVSSHTVNEDPRRISELLDNTQPSVTASLQTKNPDRRVDQIPPPPSMPEESSAAPSKTTVTPDTSLTASDAQQIKKRGVGRPRKAATTSTKDSEGDRPEMTSPSNTLNEEPPQALPLLEEAQAPAASSRETMEPDSHSEQIASSPPKTEESSTAPSKRTITPNRSFAAPDALQTKKRGVSRPKKVATTSDVPFSAANDSESKDNGRSNQAKDNLSPSVTGLSGSQSERRVGTPKRPAVSFSSPLKKAEGSPDKNILFDELKAMKIASIQARNASLEAEIAAKRAKLEEVSQELENPAAETVKRHIKLLHDYNDIRDVGQGLVGMIADNRGVRIGELYDEFGVGLKD